MVLAPSGRAHFILILLCVPSCLSIHCNVARNLFYPAEQTLAGCRCKEVHIAWFVFCRSAVGEQFQ